MQHGEPQEVRVRGRGEGPAWEGGRGWAPLPRCPGPMLCSGPSDAAEPGPHSPRRSTQLGELQLVKETRLT